MWTVQRDRQDALPPVISRAMLGGKVGKMSDATAKPLAQPANLQLAANVYKAITDNITFSKRQQWAITNYTVLIFGALFGLSRAFHETITSCERIVITMISVGAGAGAIALLIKIQMDLGRMRGQLRSIHEHWFSETERQVMQFRPYGTYTFVRGIDFVGSLIAVVSVSGLLLGYSIWR
jgi:hypothetical protein